MEFLETISRFLMPAVPGILRTDWRAGNKTRKFRVVITHCLSDSNKGVVAVLLATIRKIRQHYPDAEIVLHSMYREDHKRFEYHARFVRQENVEVREGVLPTPYIDDAASGILSDIPAIFRLFKSIVAVFSIPFLPLGVARMLFSSQAQAYETLQSADLILMKGGHDIGNEPGGLRGRLYFWRILKMISICTRSTAPVVVLGQSIGRIRSENDGRRVRDILKQCSKVIVRDDISREKLAGFGLSDNVTVMPDIGFLTEPEPSDARYLEHVKGKLAGITVVNWPYGDSSGSSGQTLMERYTTVLTDALERTYKDLGATPVFVLQDMTTFHGSSDMQLIDDLSERLRRRDVPVHVIDQDLSPIALADIYQRCEIVIGTRFHSCVLAAAAGTPSIAIEYQGTKTRGLLRSLNLENYVHDLGSLSADALLESIQSMFANRAVIAASLQADVASFRSSIDTTVSEILDELGPACDPSSSCSGHADAIDGIDDGGTSASVTADGR
jgi:polysaccharide pyruvyl transferase WcaK-like protein